MRKFLVLVFAFLLLAPGMAQTESVGKDYLASLTLEGAGASFPNPIYQQWASDFNKLTGMKVNYQSIGSGGGIKAIKAKTVHFGASDAPLTSEELAVDGMIQFPMIIGGVVPVLNLPGIKPGELQLSPAILADIYLGKITNWNDAALAKLNPNVKLPEKDITVVHRSDGSGTTWLFTNYLTKVSKEWADKVGNDKSVAWPTGVGGKGNEGVANNVKQLEGGIGYVEYAYALQNKLTHARLQNKAGKFIEPTADSFSAAAANADWKSTPDFAVILTDQPGDTSWPIVGVSWLIIYKNQNVYAKGDDWKRARAMLEYFDWCYRNGAEMAEKLDYVAIPMSVAALVEEAWATSITADNKAVWEVAKAEFKLDPAIKDIISKTTVEGAGASFPNPIYQQWASDFNKLTGMKVNYQSIGSGGGIKAIKAKTVHFGASDAPLTSEDLAASGLIQFPMIIGGVVPVLNLPGIKPGELQLSPAILADIYLGKITNWNDAALAKLNPNVKLPEKDITVVHRSDGSGTTWLFTNYLTKVSKEWADKVGNDKSVAWPTGVGGKGNEGVANNVKQLEGGIGYVEYAYALQNKLTHARLQNKAGKFIEPTADSFSAAAANADWNGTPDFAVILTDQPGETSWPIVGVSWLIVYKEQADMNLARCMLSFFSWSLHNGGEQAVKLDYVPIPMNVVKLIEDSWSKDLKCNGQQVWK